MKWEDHIAKFRADVAEMAEGLPERPREEGLVPIQHALIDWAMDFADRAEAGNV